MCALKNLKLIELYIINCNFECNLKLIPFINVSDLLSLNIHKSDCDCNCICGKLLLLLFI